VRIAIWQKGKPGFIIRKPPKITFPKINLNAQGILVLVFCGLITCLAPPPLHAGDPEASQYTQLQSLNIQSLKRELRIFKVNKNTPPQLSAMLDKYVQNNFREALTMAESLSQTILSERKTASDFFLIYGNASFFLGQSEEAVKAYQRSFRLAAFPSQKAAAMANFGLILSKQSRWKEAASWIESALEIDRDQDHWAEQGIALSLLGNIYFQLGDTEKGAAAHIESLEIAEIIPVPWLEGRQSNFLANLYYLDGVLHLSENYFQKALKIYRALGDPLGEASALTGLGFVFKDTSLFDKALQHQSSALAIYRRLRDKAKETKALLNVSLIHRDQGDFNKALSFSDQAFSIQENEGHIRGMAEIEGTIGTIYQKKGDLPEAIQHLETSRQLFSKAKASQQIHIVDLRIRMLKDQLGK
jgi:tetratricopeptide (TPR) repeat protein